MNDFRKFQADMRRMMKYERSISAYEPRNICSKAAALFVSDNRGLGKLPDAIADYWIKTYIETSPRPDDEPTEKNIDRLAAMQSFLEGTDDGTEVLSAQDWKELGNLVSCEADDLPLDVLRNLMEIIVEKKALN